MTDAINEIQDLRSPMQEMPESGPLFVFDRPVRTGDVDEEKQLRLDGVARYLQDIASDQVGAMGEGVINPIWIVRRTVIDVVKPITWPTRVHLERWCSAMSTRWATMRVDIDGEDGGRIETEAFWININPETGMPTRIGDELERVLSARTTEHRLRWRPLLKDAAPDVPETPFPLRFTDIDPMRHLNNTVYLHVIEGLLSERPDLQTAPYRMIIEYLRPIARDSAVAIRGRDDEDGLAVWFMVDGVDHARVRVLAL
ncbi:acyl-[acyl-carrier-protein] thioesterase [Tomitella biformata]|uniref:acyl-[acyl-carrier-protein] thioesterase n=1 Tax=Tomitella biformata TaxID=630403 RepID=UPI0004B6248B|nr:acyl-ACP thioesterase domain-containing protein [Tomitella biformata]